MPGYRTQLAADRWIEVTAKRVLDVYALWSFGPDAALRLLANNAVARDYTSTTGVAAADFDEVAATTTRSRVNVQLRLELKL